MNRYYKQGFIDKCAEYNINPNVLLKEAQADYSQNLPWWTGVGAVQNLGTYLGDNSSSIESAAKKVGKVGRDIGTSAAMGYRGVQNTGTWLGNKSPAVESAIGTGVRGIQGAGTWLGNQTANMHPIKNEQGVGGRAMQAGQTASSWMGNKLR
jgi:hypothetical protein